MSDGAHEHTVTADNSIAPIGSASSAGAANHTTSSTTSATTPACFPSRDVVPLPFVRKLRYNMDSCAGTNNSQFCFGGLGLLCATGILDAVNVSFMVVGHTKFDPDLVANKIAQQYNKEDSFNQAALLQHMHDVSSAQAYDGDLLETWKEGTKTLFGAVNHIMTYRQFLIVADDGAVDFGPSISLLSDMEPFPDDGPMYGVDAVDAAVNRLAERTLVTKLLPAALAGTAISIDSAVGGRVDAAAPRRILPDSVEECRGFRLLMRRSHEEVVWREQVRWSRRCDMSSVNNALLLIKPYGFDRTPGQSGRVTGSKQVAITSMPQSTTRDTALHRTTSNAAEGVPNAQVTHRWSTARDEPRLREILLASFGGVAPRSGADVAKLAA
eukprot:IDg11397t1